AFADAAGIDVVEVNNVARSVRLRGTSASMGAAFGVDLGAYQVDGLTYRGREGSIYVPDALGDAVVAVLGPAHLPPARPPLPAPHGGRPPRHSVRHTNGNARAGRPRGELLATGHRGSVRLSDRRRRQRRDRRDHRARRRLPNRRPRHLLRRPGPAYAGRRGGA